MRNIHTCEVREVHIYQIPLSHSLCIFLHLSPFLFRFLLCPSPHHHLSRILCDVLNTSARLFLSVCSSLVRPSVRPSVCPSDQWFPRPAARVWWSWKWLFRELSCKNWHNMLRRSLIVLTAYTRHKWPPIRSRPLYIVIRKALGRWEGLEDVEPSRTSPTQLSPTPSTKPLKYST